jgi:dihydrofolate reductase
VTSLTLVAALDRAGAIGRGGGLPWHLPDDLKRFRQLTLGRPLLMGRRTAESLGRALPGRRNLVLSRSARVPFEGMLAVASLAQAIELAGEDELMVIGGGEVYALALPAARRMWLTHVDTEVAGADTFFPRFDPADWIVASRSPHPPDDSHAFGFETVEYRRR